MKKLLVACLLAASGSAFCAPGDAIIEHKGNVAQCDVVDFRNPNMEHYMLRNCTNPEIVQIIDNANKRKLTDRYTGLPLKVYGQRTICWTESLIPARNEDGSVSAEKWDAQCFYRIPKQQ